jgi:hypothetical protein
MLSADVKKFYDENKIDELYKYAKKYFDKIDEWAIKFLEGDLLSEYDLKYAQQQLNSCQTLLNVIAGTFEALVVEYENNHILKEEEKFPSMRVQDYNHCKAYARSQVSDLRRYATDFSRYVNSAQNSVVTVQSLLKRQTIEKANKNLDTTGDTSNVGSKKWDE